MAETSPGRGSACSLSVSEVSTCERVAKKVDRSGRRGGCWSEVEVGWLGTLCSTVGGVQWTCNLESLEGGRMGRERTFIGSHDGNLYVGQ